MALRIWLPLNGDLKNIGCSRNISITSNGATVDNNGKIGKCYSFGTNKYLKINDYASEFLTYDEFSLSVWFKCTAQNTSHRGSALISGGNWNQAENLLILALGDFSSDHYTRLLVSGSGGWASGYSYNFYLNQWYHVVLTSGNGAVRAYVNGELIGDTYAAFKPSSLEQTWICIGNGTYTQSFHFNGLMNDVRIYDHCLSTLEVKEISQGLVLHYKLNGQNGGAGENLILNSKLHEQEAKNNSYNYFWAVPNGTLTVGETYTFSAIVKVNGTNPPQTCTVYNYTNGSQTGPITHNFIADGVTRDSFTFVANATGFICYAGKSGSTTNFSATYREMKLEKGPIATPWIPASSEMNKDFTKITDSSGYENNGTLVGILASSTESSKYGLCTSFTGTTANYIKKTPFTLNSTNWTVSLWYYYPKAVTSTWESLFCLSKGDGSDTNKKIAMLFNSGNANHLWCKVESGGARTIPIRSNKWTHLVLTSQGKLYENGVQKSTITPGTTLTGANDLVIGARSASANVGSVSLPFSGKISDFRIYASVLSEEDILALHNIPAQIDKLGSIHGYEFVEDGGKQSVYKTGQIANNWDTKTYLVNNFGETNTMTGWSFGGSPTISNGVVTLTGVNPSIFSDVFTVNPDDIIVIEFGLEMPVTSTTTSGPGVYLGVPGSSTTPATRYQYNFTTKTWITASTNDNNPYFMYSYNRTEYYHCKTYLLGSNRTIDDLPPAQTTATDRTLYALKLNSAVTTSRIRSGYNTNTTMTIKLNDFKIYKLDNGGFCEGKDIAKISKGYYQANTFIEK